MSATFHAIFRRDCRLALRNPWQAAYPALFIILFATLVPLALGPEPQWLSRLAPGLLWLAALLALLLGIEGWFAEDARNGTLEWLVSLRRPLYAYSLARLAALTLTLGAPLLLLLPVAGLLLGLGIGDVLLLLLSLSLGLPCLIALGGVGAALTLGARRGGVLLMLLLIPLYVPILIFGAAAASGGKEATLLGSDPVAPFLFLAALLAVFLPLLPALTAAAIRQAIEDGSC